MESLKEAVDHAEGRRKLKTTIVKVMDLPVYTPEKIKSIRSELCLTQQSFADVVGVSLRTIESWEGGATHPNGPSRRLLFLLGEKNIAKEVSECLMKIG